MTTKTKQDHMTPVNSWKEVPEFDSEEQEHEFWSQHSLGEALLEQMSPRTFEEEMASMVRIVGNSFNGDFDLTLDLPERVVKELAACANDPSRLALLEFILANQMSLMRGFLRMADHQSEVRELEEEAPSQGEDGYAFIDFGGNPERGLLDYQEAFSAALIETTTISTSIRNRLTESSELLNEETSKLKRSGLNPAVAALSVKKVAKFLHGYAEGIKNDARKLKESAAVVDENFRGFINTTRRQRGDESSISAMRVFIVNMQVSLKNLKASSEEYREHIRGSFDRESGRNSYDIAHLRKATERVDAAFEQHSDAVDELIAFTEMALKQID